MFTRRHYVAIAEAIRRADRKEARKIGASKVLIIRDVAKELADLFAADNRRFDAAKFLAACGYEEKAK